jgi:hypothetical protein
VSDHVRAAVHEFSGALLWDDYGDSPYWALRQLYQDVGGGLSNVDVEIDGEEWSVSLGYQESGLEPRRSDDVDQLYEYRIAADGAGERKLRLLVQPRLGWDDPERRPQSVPASLGEAVAVRAEQCSNVHPVEVRDLIPAVFQAVADERDLDWSDRYLTGTPHEYSAVTMLELYLRVERQTARKLVGGSGVFRALWDVVADQAGSKVVYSADNTEIVGYNHQLRFDEAAASRLFDDAPGPRHGWQLKHYHPKYVRSEEHSDDPLYHPKLGALFKKSLNDGAVAFADVGDLLDELEENLINVLDWGDVPTRPTSPPFVADDHFSARASDRVVEIYDDPTPTIERDQESVLVQTMTRLEDSDLDVLDQLIADGGQADVDELADEAGWSVRTVYRVLDRLDEIIGSQDGSVSFLSRKIQQDVREVVDRVESTVQAGARVVEDLLGIDQRDVERAGRAFRNWLAEYGIDVVDDGADGGRMQLRARTALALAKSRPEPFAPEVADYGALCWSKTGRDPGEIARARLTFDEALSGETRTVPIGTLRRKLR